MYLSADCVCVSQMDSFMSGLGLNAFSSSTVQTTKSVSSTCNGAMSNATSSPARTAASVSLTNLYYVSLMLVLALESWH